MRLGDFIDDRFELLETVGAGGMGVVYRARDRESGAQVAIKLIPVPSPKLVERLAREAAMLRRASHPNVVAYVAHGEGGETPFLAMEWVEGESLEQRLGRGPLSVDDTLTLAAELADALAAIHQGGVVHRDLKPDNIFLEGGRLDRVKLLDFGVACDLTDESLASGEGMIVGTPLYMSPEQAGDPRRIDARSDVFALGCVLYECLTDGPAFGGGTIAAILAKILFVEPEPPAIEPDVDRFVLELLRKDPAGRPADGSAVRTRLRTLAATASTSVELVIEETLSSAERRVVSLVMGSSAPDARPDPRETLTFGEVEGLYASATEALGDIGEPHLMADGTVVLLISRPGEIVECASQACHGALRLAEALPPGGRVAVATGRANTSAGVPIGEAIDRVSALFSDAHVGGRVAIDELTANLVASRFGVESFMGRSTLVGPREEASLDRLLLGKRTLTVGREDELDLLRRTTRSALETPEARTILVTGETGMGKSRLRYELLRELRTSAPALRTFIARASGVGTGAPFAMAATLLREAAEIQRGATTEAQISALRTRFEGLGAPRGDAKVALLAHLLGLESELPYALSLASDPKLRFTILRRAWIDWLRVECDAGPVMLVLEDLHRADDESVQLIDAALHALSRRALVVLALADDHARLGELWPGRSVTRLPLQPMSADACEALVRQVLGVAADPGMVRGLVERAGGNAFFLEELLRQAVAGADQSTDTPLAIVQSRLEALEPAERRFLRAASVFGERAWVGGVASLAGIPNERVKELVSRLVDAELVQVSRTARFTGETEIVFRHQLLREAAYEMLTEEDRRLGHKLAAGWLEGAGEEDLQVLAEHLERGADDDELILRTAEHWRRLADQTVLGDERVRFVMRARDLIERMSEGRERDEASISARVAQCQALIWAGQNAEAMEELEGTLALAEERSLADAELACHSMLSLALTLSGRLDEAREHSTRAEELMGTHASPQLRCELLLRRAYIAWYEGDHAEGVALFTEHFTMAEDADLTRDAAVGSHNVGDACARMGRYGEAVEWLERSTKIAATIGYDALIAQNERVLGFIEAWWLDQPDGRARIVRALEIAEAGAYQWDAFQARHALALVDAHLGDREAARAVFAELTEEAEEAGHAAMATRARQAMEAIDAGEVPEPAF